MSTLTLVIVITFVLGYLGIALESSLKVNKAALALLMCVICWTLFSLPKRLSVVSTGSTS